MAEEMKSGFDIADKTNPVYDDRIEDWQLCRDAVAGERVVKSKGTTYLPTQGVNMDLTTADGVERYNAYKQRAVFEDMTEVTVESMTGIAFKTTPSINFSEFDEVAYLEQNIDGAGTMFKEQMKSALSGVIITGRGALFVDYPRAEESSLATDKELQASIHYYEAEDVVNWRTGSKNGNRRLEFVVLREKLAKETADIFGHDDDEAYQYRVLMINSDDVVEGFVVDKNDVIIEEPYILKAAGKMLDVIPFFLISAHGTTIDVSEKPPVLKVANVNMAHYRTTAEMYLSMHYHSAPQPVATGTTASWREEYAASGAKFGTDEVLCLEEGANMFLLQGQFDAQGFHKELERLRQTALDLGAKLLTNQTAGVESAEAIRLKESGGLSTMASIILSLSSAYAEAVKMANKYMAGGEIEPKIELNTELLKPSPDASLVTSLLTSIDRQVVGVSVLRDYLRAVGVIPADMSNEDVEEELSSQITGVPFPDSANVDEGVE